MPLSVQNKNAYNFMDLISYRCLEAYHANVIKNDIAPKIINFGVLEKILDGDFSGENLVSKLILTETNWQDAISAKGVGQRKKYLKLQSYRWNLIAAWKEIEEKVNSGNESEIVKMMAQHLWDFKGEFVQSYLGLTEMAIKLNLLWKNPICSAIFCNYYEFVIQGFKTLETIAKENGMSYERIRQIKEKTIKNFEDVFWFFRDALVVNKILELFDLSAHQPDQIAKQAEIINIKENVNFSPEFYIIMLSLGTNLKLVGNITDLKSINKRSSEGNVWKSLYLQSPEEKNRCDLENLINKLAVEMHQNSYYFKTDTVFEINAFAELPLSASEIENYNHIISEEMEISAILTPISVVISRNSIITQPEMVEDALLALDGFAYADDILNKLKILYADKEWSMPMLRSSLRGEKFYSIGKSGLFGLTEIKDVRPLIGDGTLNRVMEIYMLDKNFPVHYYELLVHINALFPRPKNLHAVHTILEQDSKNLFTRFEGGFYGLTSRHYASVNFPRVIGFHGRRLGQLVQNSEGIGIDVIRKELNNLYTLEEIQIEYLLYKMIAEHRAILKDGLYYPFVQDEFQDIEMQAIDASDELEFEVSKDELDFEELTQPEVSQDILMDPISQVKIRRGQPKFRLQLLKLYNSTCIITGCSIVEILEAAHIIPHSVASNFKLSNGLLLRADIHTLYDLGMLAIEPETLKIKLNDTLGESIEYSHLQDIDIQERLLALHPKYKLSEEGLRRRWNTFVELA